MTSAIFKEIISNFLKKADLDKTSAKDVRKQLEKELGIKLFHRREEFDPLITEVVREIYNDRASSANEDTSGDDSGADSGNEQDAPFIVVVKDNFMALSRNINISDESNYVDNRWINEITEATRNETRPYLMRRLDRQKKEANKPREIFQAIAPVPDHPKAASALPKESSPLHHRSSVHSQRIKLIRALRQYQKHMVRLNLNGTLEKWGCAPPASQPSPASKPVLASPIRPMAPVAADSTNAKSDPPLPTTEANGDSVEPLALHMTKTQKEIHPCQYCGWMGACSPSMLSYHAEHFHQEDMDRDQKFEAEVRAGRVEPLDC